jgi:hypothetical protein
MWVHIQSTWGSTFSPRTWIHVDPMAFNVEGGNQGHGGESWGSPMPPESDDPRVCRAWPGVGTTFSNPLNTVQQLVEQRIPSVVDDGGFNGADNVRENPPIRANRELSSWFLPPRLS